MNKLTAYKIGLILAIVVIVGLVIYFYFIPNYTANVYQKGFSDGSTSIINTIRNTAEIPIFSKVGNETKLELPKGNYIKYEDKPHFDVSLYKKQKYLWIFDDDQEIASIWLCEDDNSIFTKFADATELEKWRLLLLKSKIKFNVILEEESLYY